MPAARILAMRRTPGAVAGASLNNLMSKRVAHQFCIRAHLHFHQNAAPVRADGFRAECKLVGNFTIGFAGSEEAHDLVFAFRKRFVQGLFVVRPQIKS
jgi:hypothetical protein